MNDNTQATEQTYFDLRLDRDQHGVSAAVVDSPAGQSRGRARVELDARAALTPSDNTPLDDLMAYGGALWRGLFADTGILDLWRASGASNPLLRLTIADDGLAAVPWELLFDPQAGRFTALEAGSAVVRRAPLPLPAGPQPSAPPVRVLFTGCAPAGLPPIDVAAEWRSLAAASDGRAWTATGSPQDATLSDLATGLLRGAQVWHFAGHGDEHGLIFAGRDGQSQRADAFTVGALLAGAGVQAAVINSCRAGAGGGAAATVAGALLRAGVPVVAAMQSAIPDRAAAAFCHSFYQAAALGHSLEQASTAGRRAILALGDPWGASWWMPALFSRRPAPTVLVRQPAADPVSPDARPASTVIAAGGSAISQGGVAVSGSVGGSVFVTPPKG